MFNEEKLTKLDIYVLIVALFLAVAVVFDCLNIYMNRELIPTQTEMAFRMIAEDNNIAQEETPAEEGDTTDAPSSEAPSSEVKEEKKTEKICLNVLTYHSCDNSGGQYSITPEAFEQHISALIDKGYSFVSTREIINWVKGDGVLPEKPILITFDDGYTNNYENAFPILKKYNAKATIFAVGGYVGESTRSDGSEIEPHFTLEQANEMINSGLIEVQSHTYAMHQSEADGEEYRRGVLSLVSESEEEYVESLENDIIHYKSNVLIPYAMSYPEGLYTTISERIFFANGIEISFFSRPIRNTLVKGNTNCLHLIGRIDCDSMSAETMLSKLYK